MTRTEGTPAPPPGVAVVREVVGRVGAVEPGGGPFDFVLHQVPDWTERFPWLIHGTTGAGEGGDATKADFGLFGRQTTSDLMDRWRRLRDALGTPRAAHARQVHGARVIEHTTPDPGRAPGLVVLDEADGHVTGVPGILLTVSLADCVPLSLVDPERRRVALLHGGWRGTAAGIVGVGLRALGAEPGAVFAHLGPAICGACYEVGPEVFEALGLDVPADNTPVDLRAHQARLLVDAGVPAKQVSVSSRCTRCDGEGGIAEDGGGVHGAGGAAFFSHRRGDRGRQLGVLGIR